MPISFGNRFVSPEGCTLCDLHNSATPHLSPFMLYARAFGERSKPNPQRWGRAWSIWKTGQGSRVLSKGDK